MADNIKKSLKERSKSTKKSLKERSKSTKIFYKNGQRKTHRENVLEKPTECANEILEAEKKYILKMNKTLEDSHTALKTYWTIINRLTYDEKIPAIPPLFFDDKLILDFCAKAKMFNNYFASICTPIKKRKCYTAFFIQNKRKNKLFYFQKYGKKRI